MYIHIWVNVVWIRLFLFVGKIKGGLGFKRTKKQKQFFIASPVNVIIVLHCRSYCDTKRENENLKKQTYGKGDDGDDGDDDDYDDDGDDGDDGGDGDDDGDGDGGDGDRDPTGTGRAITRTPESEQTPPMILPRAV